MNLLLHLNFYQSIYKIDGTAKKNIKLKFSKEGKPINSKYSISISHDHNYAVGVAALNIEKNYLNENYKNKH